jgi:uncharacterized protein (DUF2132 family)
MTIILVTRIGGSLFFGRREAWSRQKLEGPYFKNKLDVAMHAYGSIYLLRRQRQEDCGKRLTREKHCDPI